MKPKERYLEMVHEEYRKVLALRYMSNDLTQHFKQVISIAKRLPPPDDLTTEFIVDLITGNSYKPGGYKPNTRHNYFNIIKVICDEIKRPELMEPIPMPKKVSTVKRRDLLTPPEITSLLRACHNDTYMCALIQLLVESGCRIGEALNLHLEDVEIGDDLLHIIFDGKTGQRRLPLRKDHVPILLLFIGTHPNGNSGYIFYSARNLDKPCGQGTIRDRMVRVFKRAGVRKRDGTTHIFRHTKSTHLIDEGFSDSYLKMFMGWTKNSTMINTYLHLSARSLTEYFSRFYGIKQDPIEPLYPDEEREKIKEIFKD
jgi:integrase